MSVDFHVQTWWRSSTVFARSNPGTTVQHQRFFNPRPSTFFFIIKKTIVFARSNLGSAVQTQWRTSTRLAHENPQTL